MANNIFWENHDQTTARNGVGVAASQPNAIVLRENLFQGNGPSDVSPFGAGFNVGNGFNPLALTSTPDPVLGNFTGNPSFVTPARSSTRFGWSGVVLPRRRFRHHFGIRRH